MHVKRMKRLYRASYHMPFFAGEIGCVTGGNSRGNGLENQRDVSDGKVSDVSGEKEVTVTLPHDFFCLFCFSLLYLQAEHGDVAAAFRLHQKERRQKRVERYAT